MVGAPGWPIDGTLTNWLWHWDNPLIGWALRWSKNWLGHLSVPLICWGCRVVHWLVVALGWSIDWFGKKKPKLKRAFIGQKAINQPSCTRPPKKIETEKVSYKVKTMYQPTFFFRGGLFLRQVHILKNPA